MPTFSNYQKIENTNRVEALFLKLNTLDDRQCTHAMAELLGRIETMSKDQMGLLSDETISVVIGAIESALQNQVRHADLNPARQFVEIK